ncbi:hypothetical protein [Actinomadura nitritigenes]|uniref:Uncharacterized protein n=1 Tax=Actinomadura nitritigenes TaxID=134602 RepID=A0ABS3RCK7_9ACTN|nr:hypothetical protein [Actinomadura nitritigenes]MBO2443969.1 hypothetical protein [Actinomadura nitritigenes]
MKNRLRTALRTSPEWLSLSEANGQVAFDRPNVMDGRPGLLRHVVDC